MVAAFLQCFLSANLLLVVSYVVFAAASWALGRARIFVSHQPLVRWAQVLLLLSISVPGFFGALPGKNLPEFRMPSFRSGSEGAGFHAKKGTDQKFESQLFQKEERGATPLRELVSELRKGEGTSAALLFFYGWLLGLFIFGIRLGARFAKLHRLLANTIPIRSQGKIRIVVSSTLAVPISAFHWRKYWVVLPEQLLQSPKDFRLALKHELQHHRQGDTLWAVLIEWVVLFFYLNPAAYLWKRKIVELQEFSCDEALVGQQRISSREYGSCLVRVAETALGCREVYVGTTYMAAAAKNPAYFKSFLSRRIEMLVNHKRLRSGKWVGLCMGTLGLIVTVSLAYGVERSTRAVKDALPNAGNVVVDEKIQRITQKILSDAINKQEASDGFAIVADPQSGRILAVANIDTKNKKTGYWALAEQLEPASIAKTLVAAEAIEQGKTTPTEKHFCENGNYNFAGQTFHDWRETGFGHLTTAQTIAKSSDICTVKIAEKVGLEGIHALLEKYGFGPGGTAKEFPGGRVGQLPPREGALGKFLIPYVAYGQGFRSTALELVQAYGAIANGGNLLMPISADSPESAKKVVRRVLSEENAEKVKGILREVVLSGTGKQNAGSYLYTTAGKTGSAFSPDEEWLETSRGTRKSNVAGFIGFAPVNNPRVEVFVSIRNPKVSEEPGSGAHGAEHAAPVFKQITEAVLQQMKVAPDYLQQM